MTDTEPNCPMCAKHCDPAIRALVVIRQAEPGRCTSDVHLRSAVDPYDVARVLGDLAVQIADQAIDTEVRTSIRKLGEMLGQEHGDA